MNRTEYQRETAGALDKRADQVFVTMRDGVRLATDVYLPDGLQARVPAVLVRLPYDKSGAFSFMPQIAEYFNAEGFAFVAQDVRGKFRSEGNTFAFVKEVPDGYDTLEWLASQSWSSGEVGMFGDSYYGFTQWAAAMSAHPALKAIVPRMTTTEIGTDWMYHQGVFCLATMAEWAASTWIDNDTLVPAGLDQLSETLSVTPLRQVVAAMYDGLDSESFRTWIQHPPFARFWTDDVYAGQPVEWGRIPTLHSGGFFDVFSRGQLRDFARSLQGPRPHDQYLIMGATDHFDDQLTVEGRWPEYDAADFVKHSFGSYLGPALEFFDVYLRGADRHIPRVRWQHGVAGWRESTSWPPADARELSLHLGDGSRALQDAFGGVLAASPHEQATAVTWLHDPANPVPTLVTDPWRPLLQLPDDRVAQVRSDVATFTSDAFTTGLDLAGPVRLATQLRADAPSAHICARLTDVSPTGEARLILEGACLAEAPAAGTAVVVDLGDTGYAVLPGHSLRLAVSASLYPRYAVSTGRADSPFDSVELRSYEQGITVGGANGARLSLTVL